jgi:hypothetical protein
MNKNGEKSGTSAPVERQVIAALCDFNEDSSRKSLLARPFDVADTHTDTQALPRVCWVFSTVESILMLLARQITRLHVINVFIFGRQERNDAFPHFCDAASLLVCIVGFICWFSAIHSQQRF